MIVTKAVNMARMMNIPVLGLVENYSYFQCPDCGHKHAIFGESHLEQVAKDLEVPILAQLPMDPALAAAFDSGKLEDMKENYLEPVAHGWTAKNRACKQKTGEAAIAAVSPVFDV